MSYRSPNLGSSASGAGLGPGHRPASAWPPEGFWGWGDVQVLNIPRGCGAIVEQHVRRFTNRLLKVGRIVTVEEIKQKNKKEI